MSGWQGSGWNPQQDPYGQGGQGQYGADPYGQYGSDPYAQQQYGSDPYGQPAVDPYNQYGMDPYGGYQPEPPPKRSKLPMVLSIVVILAAVGTVVTIVLLNRGGDDPAPTAGPGGSSSSKPPDSTKSSPSSRRPPTSSSGSAPSGKDGWTTYDFAGGSYQAPSDWKKDTVTRKTSLGVDFAPGAVFGTYDCEGGQYFRGFTATGEAQTKDGTEPNLGKTVVDFANSFATEYYPSPRFDAKPPKEGTVGGKKAATATVKVTVSPTKPACEATNAEIVLIGVPIEKDGKAVGVRMLVVVNDLAGGPSDPKALPDSLAEEIVATLTLK